MIIERCDSCERFEDDLAAALSRYSTAGWFQCEDGGWHALAEPTSLRSFHANRRGKTAARPARRGQSASGQHALAVAGVGAMDESAYRPQIEAAHLLPFGAPGSGEDARGFIALSPTYRRACDAGLIFLDDQYRMRLNEKQAHLLRAVDLAGGIGAFRAPLGEIFPPPDPAQRSAPDFIRPANRRRQIG